jgi:UDP-glucose 4-epimerase
MKILVTGGTGFIGSETVVELLKNDYQVVIIDNFSNSKEQVLSNIKKITNKDFKFYEGNVQDKSLLEKIFTENKIDAVIHFAGFKAVGESVSKPLMYYDNNLSSTIVLCEVMTKYNCKKLVFSSSATVYGAPKELPIKEDFPLHTTNPYGTTKLMIETILGDLAKSDPTWHIAILRYFNPIGADKSGLLGEDPEGLPNNLMPYIVKVATKELPILNVFGNDYPTKDGTGVRDYIHVIDLAAGHLKAIEYLNKHQGLDYFNLGTGTGYSVLDIIKTFEKVNKVKVNYKIVARRPGDIASCYADPTKALKLLGFKANYNLEDMCQDSYNYVRRLNEENKD